MTKHPAVRWLLADRRTGRLVVGQKPNALMLLCVGATAALGTAARRGAPREAARVVQAGSLGLWALDELLRGANPFRRIAGGLVLAAVTRRVMS